MMCIFTSSSRLCTHHDAVDSIEVAWRMQGRFALTYSFSYFSAWVPSNEFYCILAQAKHSAEVSELTSLVEAKEAELILAAEQLVAEQKVLQDAEQARISGLKPIRTQKI